MKEKKNNLFAIANRKLRRTGIIKSFDFYIYILIIGTIANI